MSFFGFVDIADVILMDHRGELMRLGVQVEKLTSKKGLPYYKVYDGVRWRTMKAEDLVKFMREFGYK